MIEAHALYGLAWIAFGFSHSLLAANAVKAYLKPLLGRGYRLAYNLVALVSVALVVAVGWRLFQGAASFAVPRPLAATMIAAQVAGVGTLIAGLMRYDLGRFAGTAQLRKGFAEPEDEPLRIDGIHRWVRHPIYAGGFLILWGRASDPLSLATAVWGSLYLLVGMALEERKLLGLYGEAYARYRSHVPALIPWKGPAS